MVGLWEHILAIAFLRLCPIRHGGSTTTDHLFIFVRNVPSGFKKILRRDPTGVPNALFGYIGTWDAFFRDYLRHVDGS